MTTAFTDKLNLRLIRVSDYIQRSSSSVDSFKRSRSDHSDFVFVDGDTANVKFFELSRIINKRMIKKRGIEYLVEWKDYGSEHDVWRSLSELGNALDFVDEYEAAMIRSTLSGRLVSPSGLTSSSSSVSSSPTVSSGFKLAKPAAQKGILGKPSKPATSTTLTRKSLSAMAPPKQSFAVVIPSKSAHSFTSISAPLAKSASQSTSAPLGPSNALVRY